MTPRQGQTYQLLVALQTRTQDVEILQRQWDPINSDRSDSGRVSRANSDGIDETAQQEVGVDDWPFSFISFASPGRVIKCQSRIFQHLSFFFLIFLLSGRSLFLSFVRSCPSVPFSSLHFVSPPVPHSSSFLVSISHFIQSRRCDLQA